MKQSKKQILSRAAFFLFLLLLLSIPVIADIYADPALNEENPPDSSVVLTDAFTIVAGYDSYVHPVNQQQVVITEDEKFQNGGIWYQYPIDLSYDFDFEMYIYLGNKDQYSKGADGMTFTLHNDARGTQAIGSGGGAIGAYGNSTNPNIYIENALTIEMDTYLNPTSIDPDVSANALTHFGVVTPDTFENTSLQGHSNLQEVYDGYFLMDEWRTFNVSWDAAASTLHYQFESLPAQSYAVDVQSQFGGTDVYWGFTGATGSSTNFQSIAVAKLPQEPILSLTKKVRNITSGESGFQADTTANPGDIVEFRIDITNLSASIVDLIDTVFTDNLDTAMTYQPGTFSVGGTPVTPDLTAGTLSASIGDVLAGENAVITFQCQLSGNGDQGVVSNKASIKSRYSTAEDTSEACVYIQPNISISKNVNKAEAYTGDTLTYTVLLKNAANAGYWDGKITDQLSGDLGNITVSIDESNYSGPALSPVVSAGKLVTIDNITLKGGESLAVTIQGEIQVENEQISDNHLILNQAEATGSGRTVSGSGPEKTVKSTQAATSLQQDEAAFTIIKSLDKPTSDKEAFVFRIEYKKSESSVSTDEILYSVVHIAAGQNSGSIRFPDMKPGFYSVTEIESRWRYEIDSSTDPVQNQTISWKTGQDYTFIFLNNQSSSLWQSGDAVVVNYMEEL